MTGEHNTLHRQYSCVWVQPQDYTADPIYEPALGGPTPIRRSIVFGERTSVSISCNGGGCCAYQSYACKRGPGGGGTHTATPPPESEGFKDLRTRKAAEVRSNIIQIRNDLAEPTFVSICPFRGTLVMKRNSRVHVTEVVGPDPRPLRIAFRQGTFRTVSQTKEAGEKRMFCSGMGLLIIGSCLVMGGTWVRVFLVPLLGPNASSLD